MKRETIFSREPQKAYRYTLWRAWQQTGQKQNHFVMFIGLNPSTADQESDDLTVRRCVGFAKNWGYGALCITNLFAFRATSPKVMKQQNNPVGKHNLRHLIECGTQADLTVAAWGAAGVHRKQNTFVLEKLSEKGINLFHLGLTKHGHPRHPLYLKADAKPKLFKPRKDGRYEQ